MKEPPCSCSGPGFCPRFQIYQEGYAYKLCSNTCDDPPCTEAQSDHKRKIWRERLAKGEPPSVTRKLVNFGVSMIESAKSGFKRVPLEVYEYRKGQCEKCDFNKNHTCSHPRCGCPTTKRLLSMLGIPGKLDLATEQCPMGFWGRVDHAS